MMNKKLIGLGFLTVFMFVFAGNVNAVSYQPVNIHNWNTVEKGRCGLMVKYFPTRPGIKTVKVIAYWKSYVRGGWHKLDWGDGSSVDVNSFRGAKLFYHNYAVNSSTITFTTDKIDGNETSCTVSAPVNFVQNQ